MTIFYPTSTKKISDVQELPVDNINIENIDLLSIQNKTGQIYKIKLSKLGELLSINYDDILSDGQTQFLVGRYSAGQGPLQEIYIGDNISLNSDTGLLDCNLFLVGEAGGVLEGDFPNPQLKPSTIYPKHLAKITPKTILGRASLEEGPPEEILLGPEFDLETETKSLRIISTANKLVSTGFVTEVIKNGLDFTALPTKLYLVESDLNITVDASTFGNFKSGSQFILINKGTADINIVLSQGVISMQETLINSIHIISDGEGNTIIL